MSERDTSTSLKIGDELELAIEKPVAGGRMLARRDREVVLVQGGIPGERVLVRVDRRDRHVAFATAIRILERSADRRGGDEPEDLSCGGSLYAHVEYARQLILKAQVVEDAFTRLGRLTLPSGVAVAASPERGYRMRARLHVRGTTIGFYREGTHDLCDARATGQLTDAALDAAASAAEVIVRAGCPLSGVELSENLEGNERVLHVTASMGATLTNTALDEAREAAHLTGCSGRATDGVLRVSGVPSVIDPLALVTGGRATEGTLERHAESFFQGNRFLLPQLVGAVVEAVPADGEVLDLYAGVGLFSVALASVGRARITAVEGVRTSASDLVRNARAFVEAIRPVASSVETFLRGRRPQPATTIVLDPPRTGVSREALDAVVRQGADRIVYVSCDPPTMARDARRLLDASYRILAIQGFDLFPNTPHVEAVGVFERG